MDTNNFRINKILNKDSAKYTMVLMMVFVFYVIIEHVLKLTKSVYAYNTSVDYGTHLKNVCGKNYYEYETPRFQFADNEKDIKLENDNNTNQYTTFILVITIIISLFISAIFTYLVYNTFVNTSFLYKFVDLEKYVCASSSSNSIQYIWAYITCAFIQLFIDPFKIAYQLIRKLLIVDNLSLWFKNLSFLIYILIAYVVTGVILVIMPIYIGLILNLGQDISPFSVYVSIYGWYIALFVILILMRFLYYLFYNEFESDVSSWVLTEYLSNNVKNLYTGNNITGVIGYFICLAVYIVVFFILGNVIRIYKNYQLDTKTREEHETDKYNNVNIRQSVIDGFMNSIFGYREYNNFEVPNIFIKNLSGITFILFIIICVIISCIFVCNFLGMHPNVYKLLAYGIVIPFLVLFIILFLTKTTTEYNSYFNKYIVSEPIRLYKQYIMNMHTIFNTIVQNEYRDIDLSGGYVCRNIGNGILLTLYSDIFNGMDRVNKNSVPVEDDFIDMTPEFIYDKQCNSAVVFNFSDKNRVEYSIAYYLNGKQNKKNILHTYNDCSRVNMEALSCIGRNMVKMFDSDTLKAIIKQIFETFYVSETNVVKTEKPMQYIKQEIINKSDDAKVDLQNYTSKLKKQIHQSIYNIHNGSVYNNPNSKYIYYNEANKKFNKNNQLVDLMDIEIHHYNNKLDSNLSQVLDGNQIVSYNNIVNQIVDTYMDMLYYHLYVFAPIYTNTLLSNTDDNFRIYQQDYLRLMSKKMIETFDRINNQLSLSADKLRHDKITKYVINNYNNVWMDKIYTKNILDGIIPKTIEGITNVDIENDLKVYKKYLKDTIAIYENIKKLNDMFKTNGQRDIAFVSTLSDSQYNINICLTNFNDYVDRRKLQDSEVDPELFTKNINMIFRQENDRYDFDYIRFRMIDKVMKKELQLIDKNIYSMTVAMMALCKITLDDISAKQNIINDYMKKDMAVETVILQKTYTTNIDYYITVLNKNINSLNNDLVNYMQNNIFITNKLKDEDMSIDLSKNILKEAQDTDKLIYLVVINYIIAILSVNLIMI